MRPSPSVVLIPEDLVASPIMRVIPVNCPAFRPDLQADPPMEGPGAVSRRQAAALAALAGLPWVLIGALILH